MKIFLKNFNSRFVERGALHCQRRRVKMNLYLSFCAKKSNSLGFAADTSDGKRNGPSVPVPDWAKNSIFVPVPYLSRPKFSSRSRICAYTKYQNASLNQNDPGQPIFWPLPVPEVILSRSRKNPAKIWLPVPYPHISRLFFFPFYPGWGTTFRSEKMFFAN